MGIRCLLQPLTACIKTNWHQESFGLLFQSGNLNIILTDFLKYDFVSKV